MIPKKEVRAIWEPFRGQKQTCKTCLYCNTHTVTDIFCEYILIEGHSRPCNPAECKEQGVYKRVTPAQKRRLRTQNVKEKHPPAPAAKAPEQIETLSMQLQRPGRKVYEHGKEKET